MTTLDLNAFGVTEMSHAEKVAENGGIAPIVAAAILAAKFVGGAIAAAAVVEVVTEGGGAINDFQEGYASNRN